MFAYMKRLGALGNKPVGPSKLTKLVKGRGFNVLKKRSVTIKTESQLKESNLKSFKKEPRLNVKKFKLQNVDKKIKKKHDYLFYSII